MKLFYCTNPHAPVPTFWWVVADTPEQCTAISLEVRRIWLPFSCLAVEYEIREDQLSYLRCPSVEYAMGPIWAYQGPPWFAKGGDVHRENLFLGKMLARFRRMLDEATPLPEPCKEIFE